MYAPSRDYRHGAACEYNKNASTRPTYLPTYLLGERALLVRASSSRASLSTAVVLDPVPHRRVDSAPRSAGQGIVHDVNWLATNVPLMQSDMADGTWEANDDLLAEVISYLDTPSTFFHGHHTLIHLSRDQLRESDCFTEDTGTILLLSLLVSIICCFCYFVALRYDR